METGEWRENGRKHRFWVEEMIDSQKRCFSRKLAAELPTATLSLLHNRTLISPVPCTTLAPPPSSPPPPPSPAAPVPLLFPPSFLSFVLIGHINSLRFEPPVFATLSIFFTFNCYLNEWIWRFFIFKLFFFPFNFSSFLFGFGLDIFSFLVQEISPHSVYPSSKNVLTDKQNRQSLYTSKVSCKNWKAQ